MYHLVVYWPIYAKKIDFDSCPPEGPFSPDGSHICTSMCCHIFHWNVINYGTNNTASIISPRTKIWYWIRPATWWPYMRLCTVNKLHVRQPAPKIVRQEKQDGGQRSCCYGIFWWFLCRDCKKRHLRFSIN